MEEYYNINDIKINTTKYSLHKLQHSSISLPSTHP